MSRGIDEFREILNVPSENVVNAVSSTTNRRLTVSDAATKAGCDLRTAQQSLMTLASFTGGDLDVTNDGEIIYSFPEDFQSKLFQRSTGEKIRRVYKILYPWLFYALRISFGVALITSLAIVTTMFVAVTSSSSNSDNDDRSRNRGSMNIRSSSSSGINLNVVFGPSPFDFLYYSRPYGYYNYRYNNMNDWQDPTQAMNERMRVGDGNYVRMSFLESVFSFLFGDGDPNNRLLDERTKRIAAYIRANKGTVVAEELAPFLDPPEPINTSITLRQEGKNSDDYQSYVVDESWVMPAITRLGGVPTVTDDGDIVYSFPDLEASVGIDVDANVYDVDSTSNSNTNINANYDNANGGDWFKNPLLIKKQKEALSQPIQEEEIPFSLASPSQTVMAAGLGAANLAGCLWLARLIRSPSWSVITASNPVLALTLGRLFPWMISYAITYAAIPIIRSTINKKANDEIKERNTRRLGWRKYLDKPDKTLANKIKAARTMADQNQSVGQRIIGADVTDIGYSTKQETEEEAFRLFDQKFNHKNNKIIR